MVKNAGGKRTKGAARKFLTAKPSNKLRLSECSDEKYAYVTKMLGGCECSVTTVDNLNLLCHIRNKFSGRNKQSNFISVGTVVLVGLRSWETPPKKCDLIEVYNADEVDRLYQIPGINLTTYKPMGSSSSTDNTSEPYEEDFVFRKTPTVTLDDQHFAQNEDNDLNSTTTNTGIGLAKGTGAKTGTLIISGDEIIDIDSI
jgi:initiation factor 1A